MHDRLEYALQRWEQIRSTNGKRPHRSRPDELHAWINRDVCPVVADLMDRADFRQLALWTINQLAQGKQSAARALVYDIDGAITATAQNLAEFLQRRPIRAALRGRPAQPKKKRKQASGAVSVRIGADARRVRRKPSTAPGVDAKFVSSTQSLLQIVASRPWWDLVCEYDFFGPTAELNLKDRQQWLGPDSERVRFGEVMPYLRPSLRLPGDFIQRSLEIRIDYWRGILQTTFVALQGAFVELHGPGSQYETELRQAIQDVETPWQKLRELTDRSAEAPYREAAVRLVQIFAGYRPNADLRWLGDAAKFSGNARVWEWWVEHRGDEEIPTVVAGALAELADLYRSQVDVESLIAEKIAAHRLCLIDGCGRHEAHWEGQLLNVPWDKHGRAWTLLTAIAKAAETDGQGVDAASDLGISLPDARADLRKLLPGGLFAFITIKNGVHKLVLPVIDVFCGRFTTLNQLETF